MICWLVCLTVTDRLSHWRISWMNDWPIVSYKTNDESKKCRNLGNTAIRNFKKVVWAISKRLNVRRKKGKAKYSFSVITCNWLTLAIVCLFCCLIAEANCPTPPKAPNSHVTLNHDVFGTVAAYSCYPGYRFNSGEVTRSAICIDGHWNVKVAGCKSRA